VGILALGLLVVLIAGGIDISFTATASVAQYVALAAANAYGANWLIVFAIAIGVGGTLGAINAILIQKLRIPSIIVSVATLNIFYGLLVFFTGGKYIYSLPDWFATGIFWLEFEWGKDRRRRAGGSDRPGREGAPGDLQQARRFCGPSDH
jgi:simple sugar transport system permease protein